MIISVGFIQQINHGLGFLRALVIAKPIPTVGTHTPEHIFLHPPLSLSFSVDNPSNICLSLRTATSSPVTEGAGPRDHQLQRKGDQAVCGMWPLES